MTNSVIIRFPLTKGEGELPSNDLMTEAEKKTPASMAYFWLYWDADAAGESLNGVSGETFLVEYEIIYNGISRFDEEYQKGLKVVDGEVIRYPDPMIRFVFSNEINADDFLPGIWGSCVRLRSAAQEENDEDGFFFEDHNGYCSICDEEDEEVKGYIQELKENGLYSGKVIKRDNFEEEVCLDFD